jgi:membrane-associated phospholipid phosphatase
MMTAATSSNETGNSMSPVDRDVALLRLLGIAAAFGAAWLAGRVDRRGGLRVERHFVGDAETLPGPAKAASYIATSVAYPLVYIPLAWVIASQLEKRGAQTAGAIPRTALAAWATYHVVKTLIHRERPSRAQNAATDDRSYPSGHATAAAALAFSTAFFWLGTDHGRRMNVLPLAIATPIAVGVSRVALGKHWPTDVVGGIATGVAVAAHVTATRESALANRGRDAS